MSAKHTPGPWRVAPASLYPSGINIDSVSVNKYVCLVAGNSDDKQGMEDSRLIAAAPELLEALRMLLATAGEISDAPDGLLEMALESEDQETRNQANAHLCARAAVAKATGEQA